MLTSLVATDPAVPNSAVIEGRTHERKCRISIGFQASKLDLTVRQANFLLLAFVTSATHHCRGLMKN